MTTEIEIKLIAFADEKSADACRELFESMEEQIKGLKQNNDILESMIRIGHAAAHAKKWDLLQGALCFMIAKMNGDEWPQDAADSLHEELAAFHLQYEKDTCGGRA